MKFLFAIILFMLFLSGCEDNRYADGYGTENSIGDSEQTEDDYWFSYNSVWNYPNKLRFLDWYCLLLFVINNQKKNGHVVLIK